MNNEPVAWMWSEDGCNMGVCLDQDKQIGKQEFQDYSIPLYTHPVKEQELLGEIAHLKAELDTANKAYMWMDETYKGVLAELELLKSHPVKELTDEEIHNLMDEIEILVHGDIKRAMYRMARKVESILNE